MSAENENLPEEALQILKEEEALLLRVKKVLARNEASYRKDRAARNPAALKARLVELRDLAAESKAYDLATIMQEISSLQALLNRKEEERFPDIDTPYFAHLRLEEKGRKIDYCLGRVSYVESTMGVRIIDWRYAPISRIFYRYMEGEEYEEELPGRLAEGVVDARRVVVIYKGELTRVTTPSYSLVKALDGQWRMQSTLGGSALGGGSGTAAREGCLGVGSLFTDDSRHMDISALLDRSQYEAMNSDPDKPLLVLGSAGSGKTTVALHRLASLNFNDEERFPARRMQVIVPEPGLARLSRRLLSPLGLDDVVVQTLDCWAKERFIKALNEPVPNVCEDAPGLCVALKRHPAFYRTLLKHFDRSREGGVGYRKLRQELFGFLTDREFLKEVVEASGHDLPETAIQACVKHTLMQAKTAEDLGVGGDVDDVAVGLDGGSAVNQEDLDLAGSVDLEDLPLLIIMRALRSDPGQLSLGPKNAHVVVDEAEDVSLPELFIMGKTLRDSSRSITLAGDDAQQTMSSFSSWEDSLDILGAKDAARCRLQVSYRCPKPIASLAHHVLGHLAPVEVSHAGREGLPVGRFNFPDDAQTNLFLVDALKELVEREPKASVGVIARNTESARAFFDLCNEVPRARLVLDGDFTFEPGVDVTDVGSVKGLEFDYVIIPDASAINYPMTDEARHLLHVAISRASYQLWVASSGMPSPLLSGEGGEDGAGSAPSTAAKADKPAGKASPAAKGKAEGKASPARKTAAGKSGGKKEADGGKKPSARKPAAKKS